VNKSRKKIIGISLGDPAGIGAEILLKAFPEIIKNGKFLPLVTGDFSVIERNLEFSGHKCTLNIVKDIKDIRENNLNIYDTGIITGKDFPTGKDSAICGNASFLYVSKAVSLWKSKIIDALVTLPISKKAWHLAGRFYSGHTEFLASELHADKYAMIMAAGKIRALLITTHIPLKKVPGVLTKELIIEKIITARNFLLDAGVKNPLIAVSSLNPHAGEGGVLGSEEEKIIRPAVSHLEKIGIRCIGPFPADAVFKKAFENKADIIAAMYHDQALIPLKTFFSGKLVNCTAGLGMVRTSPGHGTGFDIAYTGKAVPSSFIEAYRTAARLLSKKEHRKTD